MSIFSLMYPILEVAFWAKLNNFSFLSKLFGSDMLFSMSNKQFTFGGSLHCRNRSLLDKAERPLYRILLKWVLTLPGSSLQQLYEEQHSPIQML